jgi:hypothetical protein
MTDGDQHPYLDSHLWAFGLHSLFKEYGNIFITKIALAHPLKTLSGLKRYAATHKKSEHSQSLPEFVWEGGPDSLVGLGFCLKPLDPACLSGRANHNCLYFEEGLHLLSQPPPECCRRCFIRDAGLLVFQSGGSLYIMTSARDILTDFLLPSIRRHAYFRALLGLCPYSIEPFRIALAICGVQAEIFPFAEGDCRDYHTWREADKGIKIERTRFNPDMSDSLIQTLTGARTLSDGLNKPIQKRGNIFFCHD